MPLPELYWQRNPKYKGMHYGLPQAAAGSTLWDYGCKLCCYGLILGITPDVMQPQFVASDVYSATGSYNFILDQKVADLYKDRIRYDGRIDCVSTPAPLEVIDQLLKDNNFAMVYVDYSTAPGLQQHYVLITGKLPDGNYQIYDPYYNEIVPITKRYGKTAKQAVCGIIKLTILRPNLDAEAKNG